MDYKIEIMKKKILILCGLLFVAVYFFGFDLRGAISSAKTFVVDTAEKIIPGSRKQFDDIDSQINNAVAKNMTNENVKAITKKANKVANSLLGKARHLLRQAESNLGINPNKGKGFTATGGGGSYSFDTQKINIEQASQLRQNFIGYGLSMRGVPYASGGTSPSGFDCSGFVQYAAKKGIGVQLPRTAQQMYQSTVRIPTHALEPGDLVFFRSFGKIDHVGIYMGTYHGDGSLNGREIFLNAASRGPRTGVVVSALDEPYWKRHYTSSGRFIPSSQEVE